MELRFFKKLNGERILQQKVKKLSTLESKWVDVPMVEEQKPITLECIIRLIELYRENFTSPLETIIISKHNFRLLELILDQRTMGVKPPVSLNLMNLYGVNIEGALYLPNDKYVTISKEGEVKCNKIN